MNLRLLKLSLVCNKEIIDIPFSNDITYFYGKMGAGKSTILQLIDFCFGNELIETPALQQEFIGAQLQLHIGVYTVLLNRDKGSNQIQVQWFTNEDSEKMNTLAPISPQKDSKPLIFQTEIFSFSDLIFFLGGYNPPKVRKSKQRDASELIRLSFRDLMWYCYLDQDEIDSSFFHLEREAHTFKRLKSRDVMRLILGYHQENVSKLESDLYETRQRKTNLYGAAKQITLFLEENGIGNAEYIINKLKDIDYESLIIQSKLKDISTSIDIASIHPIDELKSEARSYAVLLDELSSSVNDINMQISQRQRLLGEFASANLKVSRSLEARQALLDVPFLSCPQCGKGIEKRKVKHNDCSLCLQPYEINMEENIDNITVLKSDLKSRYDELSVSLERLIQQREEILKTLLENQKLKLDLDLKIKEMLMDYDSAFLAKAKNLERKIGELTAEKESFKKLLPLTQKANVLEQEANELIIEEERLKRELDKARTEAEKDTTNLDKLKEYFLNNLLEVGLPGITHSDIVSISTKDFIPRVHTSNDTELFETEFSNLGSGGKKTIFKCCFILAIHQLANERNLPLPKFLMIDTPMKNISERENEDIFKGFYNHLYKLLDNELKEIQLVIVDKEYFAPPENIKDLKVISRHMTPDDSNFPPLITYYKGH